MTVEEYLKEKNKEAIESIRAKTNEDIDALRKKAEEMKEHLRIHAVRKFGLVSRPPLRRWWLGEAR